MLRMKSRRRSVSASPEEGTLMCCGGNLVVMACSSVVVEVGVVVRDASSEADAFVVEGMFVSTSLAI